MYQESPSLRNMGEPYPRTSEIPIVSIFQPIAAKYLEKRIVVEDIDMCSVSHVVALYPGCSERDVDVKGARNSADFSTDTIRYIIVPTY